MSLCICKFCILDVNMLCHDDVQTGKAHLSVWWHDWLIKNSATKFLKSWQKTKTKKPKTKPKIIQGHTISCLFWVFNKTTWQLCCTHSIQHAPLERVTTYFEGFHCHWKCSYHFHFCKDFPTMEDQGAVCVKERCKKNHPRRIQTPAAAGRSSLWPPGAPTCCYFWGGLVFVCKNK